MGKEIVGAVKVRVVRGIDLAIRDIRSSDPYMVVAMGGDQQFRTRVVNSDCNPEWNQEFTIRLSHPILPINIAVFDHDIYSKDDDMGEAEIDVKPYLECMELGLKELPIGTAVTKIQPSANNCLGDESKVMWQGKGRMVQEMILKLNNVERGEVQIQIEWVDVPGATGVSRRHNLDIYY
ncbi:hypothetical protein V2J09_021171 [Rumex salicifolius]